jgi:hypothetical protein
MNTVRLLPRNAVPRFVLPAAAFAALDRVGRAARLTSFTDSPCGPEEVHVLAVYLDGVVNDAGHEAERTELLSGCPDFFSGTGGRALVA